MPLDPDDRNTLREAYREGEITLYLGAGVSVATGLPTWEQLVVAMYFAAVDEQPMGGWRPFPNYLLAISEWHLQRSREPLEVTARKVQNYLGPEFAANLKQTLYAGYAYEGDARFHDPQRMELRHANPTLDAVAHLCEHRPRGEGGVRSVITYNYDSLLETALGMVPFKSIWKNQELPRDRLPIYHVHGYVPLHDENASTVDELVFTEEQYHRAARDAYSWSNLVQIQCLSSTVGMMVGLSLADRNIRRLLDAITRTPLHAQNYALLQVPSWDEPTPPELDEIHQRAISYMDRFERSGMKRPMTKGGGWQSEVKGILTQVEKLDQQQQDTILRQLGVTPIWYQEHDEVPDILRQIAS